MRVRGLSSGGEVAVGRLSALAGFVMAGLVLAPSLMAADSGIVAAARSADSARVTELIESGAAVNERAGDGSTALLWATYLRDAELVAALLQAGAEPDIANNFGVAPLLQASMTGDAAVMRLLLEHGADPAQRFPEGATPLMATARTGLSSAVALLLEHGADPNEVDEYQQQSALMWAAAEGHVDVVGQLLEAGADPDMRARIASLTDRSINADFPTGGFSALMWAARNGHTAVIDRLAQAGADVNLRNGDDATAMMIAIVNDRYDLAAHLLSLGADANDGSLYHAVEMRDATLDWFAKDGSRLRPDHDNELSGLDLIALLLDSGADPDLHYNAQLHSASMCCDTTANATPFYRAAVASDADALQLLAAHGADLDWMPPAAERGPGMGPGRGSARPPLFAAMNGGRGVSPAGGPGDVREGPPQFREAGNREPAAAVAALLAAGVDPDSTLDNGSTALHEAAQKRDLAMVRALADAGATLDAVNGDGLTALDVAEGRRAAGARPGRGGGPGFGLFGLGGGNANEATDEDVAELLRALMTEADVPIVPHGEEPGEAPAESTDSEGA